MPFGTDSPVVSSLFSIRFHDPDDAAGVVDRCGPESPAGKEPLPDFYVGPENALLKTLYDDLLSVEPQFQPVLLVGPSGVGKSHLLRGFVRLFASRFPTGRTLLLHGADYVRAIQEGLRIASLDEIRQAHRSKDLFALDDLHQIAASEQAQEELLHTLDLFRQQSARVLLAARCLPTEITLLEGLQSRLQGGLTVQLRAPQLETALWLVRQLADELELPLTEDAYAAILGSRDQTEPQSVPELRGRLLQLRQHALSESRPQQAWDGDRVQAVLAARPVESHVEPQEVIRKTARHFGLKVNDLTGPSRRQTTVLARNLAIYLIRNFTGLSYLQIGQFFGHRDHTTILHAYRRIEEQRSQANLDQTIKTISNRLSPSTPRTTPPTPPRQESKLDTRSPRRNQKR